MCIVVVIKELGILFTIWGKGASIKDVPARGERMGHGEGVKVNKDILRTQDIFN